MEKLLAVGSERTYSVWALGSTRRLGFVLNKLLAFAPSVACMKGRIPRSPAMYQFLPSAVDTSGYDGFAHAGLWYAPVSAR